MRRLKPAVLMVLAAIALFLASFRASEKPQYHNSGELKQFQELSDSLPDSFNGLFATSGACVNCHGSDPDGIASVTPFGEDVNVVDSWRSSMMANSAKDPYWQAKMRQEMMTNPGHAEDIGNFCTKCHAPLGRHAMEYTGVESYTFEHLLTDTAGMDGVSCVACHQQTTENLGNENSGNLHFADEQVAYGPFESPLVSPMALNSGYEPVYSEHIKDAGICASCHTLVTGTVDLDGNSTGETFVEQATYHEWLNSSYGEDDLNVTCQSCHMPSLGNKQPIILAAGYDTPPRAPFAEHEFAGANKLMLEIMKDNRDTLDISATEADYDATIAATLEMLQQQSLDMELFEVSRDEQMIAFDVELENRAGHKFPSGYPARRLFVQTTVYDDLANTVIWQSGEWDEDFYLLDEDENFEPHYDLITNEDQVQIYEMVMADVNGDPTTVLERADDYLKDNRLVPLGFTTEHEVYDTTLVVGDALTDLDFNQDELGFQGTGGDNIHYQVDMSANPELAIRVEVKVYYQSIPPKWTEELFAWDDPLINHFESMYEAADKTPVLIEESSFISTYVSVDEEIIEAPSVFVNSYGQLTYSAPNGGTLTLYTLGGRLVHQEKQLLLNSSLELQLSSGVYVTIIETSDGQFIDKVYIP
ncbi:multiheme c-type cytochrome [Sanyastnella coralliicola]|uniref:multiheme c-type cytochrome n=1 Tax=Sanyastnella coralliicola TaxID=3069118 RepID=UPI0027B8E666|nr:multiheme c-type cytochrome [Longitalea sp. SCSIO 12813]